MTEHKASKDLHEFVQLCSSFLILDKQHPPPGRGGGYCFFPFHPTPQPTSMYEWPERKYFLIFKTAKVVGMYSPVFRFMWRQKFLMSSGLE